jgi:hypothetical protein
MKIKYLVLIFILVSASSLHAENGISLSPPEYPDGLYLETGGGSNPENIWLEAGFSGSASKNLEYRIGICHLGVDAVDQYFTGINTGFRIKASSFITPFAGLGFYAGYASEDDNAENDNIDNDNDGIIDEDNEKKENIDKSLLGFYPETGLLIRFSNNSYISVSAKYMMTNQDKKKDFAVYSLGFSVSYK